VKLYQVVVGVSPLGVWNGGWRTVCKEVVARDWQHASRRGLQGIPQPYVYVIPLDVQEVTK